MRRFSGAGQPHGIAEAQVSVERNGPPGSFADQRRIDIGYGAFSYGSLWDYARWKLEMDLGPGETYLMNDHATPFYARAITILHPRFNGCAKFRRSRADDIFGTRRSRSRRTSQTLRPEIAVGRWYADRGRMAAQAPARCQTLGEPKPDIHPRSEVSL